jgi:hypothetical protein
MVPRRYPGVHRLPEAGGVRASHVSADIAEWKGIVRASPKKRLSVAKNNFVRFVDFCLGIGALKTLPNDLKKPFGEDLQRFLNVLGQTNKDVSMLPVARAIAIAFYLICLHTHGEPCGDITRNNAIVAKKIYKDVCSRANKTRGTEKAVNWNLDLLHSLGNVVEAVASALEQDCCGTLEQLRHRLAVATSKKERRRVVSRATLLAKLRTTLFAWRLCEHTGSRPATLIEIQVFGEAEWAARRGKNKEEVAVVRFRTPRGPTFMFTTSQRKYSMAAPVEYRSLWTYDRDTGRPEHLSAMHQSFVNAFEAYDVLHTEI